MHEIEKVIDSYYDAWNEGFKTKDDTKIRDYLSANFIGHWSNSDMTEPYTYDCQFDITSALKEMDNAEKQYNPFSIAERNNGNEVVTIGIETNTINNKLHKAQSMLVWRNESGSWKLLREYIELVGN